MAEEIISVGKILSVLDEKGFSYSYAGDQNAEISGFSSLAGYRHGTLTWIKKAEGYEACGSPADITLAVVERGLKVGFDNAIEADNSKAAFFAVLRELWGADAPKSGVGTGTVIGPKAVLHDACTVGCNCTIVGEIEIGENTVIENNCVIQGRVRIGRNCIVHSGTVIGCDGFGYSFDENGAPVKVEHFGGVSIGDSVEIGANTCIDRGTIDDTVICANAKIDNLVHIAHNVQIGESACIVAGAAVCGSARIGRGAYVAPGGIVKNQIEIGEGALIGLGAVVTASVEKDTVAAGVPAKPIRAVKKGDK